jgi:membrane associated rhomboid family serine protease
VPVVFLLLLIVLAVVGYRATTVAERARLAKELRLRTERRIALARKWYRAQDPYFETLRGRTPVAPVTPAIAIVTTIWFLVIVSGSVIGGRDTLVDWGASLGPRTSNAEWWRLLTALFVHAGPLHLLACLIGLLPAGLVVERLVGPVAFGVIYLTSGVFAGLLTVSAYPMAVSAGASAAICGVYGLAFSIWVWRVLREPRVSVPWPVMKWLLVSGSVFLLYNVPSGSVPLAAELMGLLVGVISGLAIGREVGSSPIPVRRCAAMGGVTLALSIAAAIPLRGITDIRPDIDRMIATDDRTAALFRERATQLALGRISEQAMIDLIEREIIPALEREQQPLASEALVPDDQQALRDAAREYLRVRIDSWRLRATAFRKGSLSLLRQADAREGAARDLLVRIPYHPS